MPSQRIRKLLRVTGTIGALSYLVVSLPLIALFAWNPTCRSTFLNIAAHYRAKVSPLRTVHIGDSITSGGGQWSLRLSGSPIDAYNLAGNGYTVQQVRTQVKRASEYSPSAICVMAGTNDLFDERFDIEFTVSQYKLLLSEITATKAACIVTLVPYQAASTRSSQITQLNDRISELCRTFRCQIIDLNPQVAPDQKLLDRFTTDGTHFSEEAYDIWADKISDALDQSTQGEQVVPPNGP